MSDQAQPNGRKSSKPLQLHGIMSPHEHDVLSGRGNFVNYHAGNEHFRALVRKHKMAYVACPKPQKGKFSRLIVDEIRNRDPPGRFLKQDGDTKLWHDIGDKKALDKTRQALREGAPELLKELQASDGEDEIPTPHAVHKPVPARSSAGGFEEPNSPYHAMVSNQDSMPPPAVVQSGGMVLGSVPMNARASQSHTNRVVPGMVNLPSSLNAGIDAMSGGGFSTAPPQMEEMETGHAKQIPASYMSDQFEPTPINPNLQMRISGAESVSSKSSSGGGGVERGLERSDSLKFENLFTKEQGPSGGAGKAKSMHGGSSNHLSAMSFSIGDMTEASNLSAVFEDSMRITDDIPGMARKKTPPPVAAAVISMDERTKKLNMSGPLDMSMATFSEGSVGTGLSLAAYDEIERIDKV